jgi:hypothetical protein
VADWRDLSTPRDSVQDAPAPAPAPAAGGGWQGLSTPVGGATSPDAPQPPSPSLWGSETSAGGMAKDYSRIALNSFGEGDRWLAGYHTILPAMFPKLFGGAATGPIATDAATLDQQNQAALTAERAKTAAASDRAGPIMSGVSTAAGYAPAMLAAAPLTAAAGGGILAGAGEQAAMGALAAEGRGENVAKGAVGGAIGGGVAGGISKYALDPMASWAATKLGQKTGLLGDPAAITAGAQDAEKQAWAPLQKPQFTPQDVKPAYNGVKSNLPKNMQADVSSDFDGVVSRQQDLINQGQISPSDLAGFQRSLNNAASSPGERAMVGQINDNLNSVMARGGVIDDVNAAKAASLHAKAAGNLQDWSQGLSDPARLNPSMEAYNTAKQFYTRGTPEWQSLMGITKAGAPGGLQSYSVERALGPVAEGIGAAVTGTAGGAMATEAGMQLAKPAIGGAINAAKRTGIQNAIGKAYPTLVPGTANTRAAVNTGALIKSLMAGQSGGYQGIDPSAAAGYLP